MIIEIIAICMAVGIGLAQYFSERFSKYCKPFYTEILSFSAGISVTYIFLHMFPHFTQRASGLSEFLFFSVFIGFVLIHLIEKHIYKHEKKSLIKKETSQKNQIISIF